MPSPTASSAADKPAAPSNRLILTATEKGGAGKSTLVSLLSGWFSKLHPQVPVALFDPDLVNKTLTARLPAAKPLDMSNDEGGDALMRAFGSGSRVVLADGVGALQQSMFMPYLRSIDLFQLLPELNLGVTFLLIVEDEIELIEQAGTLDQATADLTADFLLVRTLRSNPNMPKWDHSPARNSLIKRGAKEMHLPHIPDVVRNTIWRERLALQTAADNPELSPWERARVGRIVRTTYEGFTSAQDILLPGSKATNGAKG